LKQKQTRRRREPRQRELEFTRRGGARQGAGRKPKGAVAGPSHAKRRSTPARHPLLVTQRLCADLPSLRQQAEFEIVRGAIADAARRDGFAIVHFSVQSNHLHYLCEARDGECLTNGMRSLGVMIARRLNQLWKRKGRVFAERFHARPLATPTEVRHALVYVLNNARKHGILGSGPDPFSSGPEFDGWTPDSVAAIWRGRDERSGPRIGVPTRAASTWLLSVGWRRRGLLDWRDIPGGKAAQRARSQDEARAADSIRRSLAAAARESAHRGRSPALRRIASAKETAGIGARPIELRGSAAARSSEAARAARRVRGDR
jgi:REP element-mobilizing transposase RayT